MTRYTVYIEEVWSRRIDVEAEDERQAQDYADDIAMDNITQAYHAQDIGGQAYFDALRTDKVTVVEWSEEEQEFWAGEL